MRDDLENNREDLEKRISDVLGETWKIDVNPNLIYAYAPPDSYPATNLGGCIKAYESLFSSRRHHMRTNYNLAMQLYGRCNLGLEIVCRQARC